MLAVVERSRIDRRTLERQNRRIRQHGFTTTAIAAR
jgi:hypothetical protein